MPKIKALIALLTLAFAGWLYFSPSVSGFGGEAGTVQCSPLAPGSAASGSLIGYTGADSLEASSGFIEEELERSGTPDAGTRAILTDRLIAACDAARDDRLAAIVMTFGVGITLIALPFPRGRRAELVAPVAP